MSALRTASGNSGADQQHSPERQPGSPSRSGSEARDVGSELAATAQLQKIRETSRKAQRRYRERQRVTVETQIGSCDVAYRLLCDVQHAEKPHDTLDCLVGFMSIHMGDMYALQDKLLTAESKVAELTKQLEELRLEKVSAASQNGRVRMHTVSQASSLVTGFVCIRTWLFHLHAADPSRLISA